MHTAMRQRSLSKLTQEWHSLLWLESLEARMNSQQPVSSAARMWDGHEAATLLSMS